MALGRTRTARVVVLTILEEEFDAVREVFGHLGPVPRAQEFWTPDPISLDVVVARAPDRGNVASRGVVGKLVEHFQPEVLLVVGIGGGIVRPDGDDHPQLGDVVLADYIHYCEFVKIARGRHLKRYAAYDQPSAPLRMRDAEAVRVEGTWANNLPSKPEGTNPPRLWICSLVSGEKIFSDPTDEFQRTVMSEHQDAKAVDMESFGAARALHEARTSVLFDPLLLVVRGVSDLVLEDPKVTPGSDNAAQRNLWRHYASKAAAAFAHATVQRIVASADDRAELRLAELAAEGGGP
jgi:nucleoside phosphorylase